MFGMGTKSETSHSWRLRTAGVRSQRLRTAGLFEAKMTNYSNPKNTLNVVIKK